MGGLDTHTSGNSLWVAAAQTGIVDIDRWVVAAVIWQSIEAVEGAHECTECCEDPIERSVEAIVVEKNEEPRAIIEGVIEPRKSQMQEVLSDGGVCNMGEKNEFIAVEKDAKNSAGRVRASSQRVLSSIEARAFWEELCCEAFKLVLSRRNVGYGEPNEGSRYLSPAFSSSDTRYTKDSTLKYTSEGDILVPKNPQDPRQRYVRMKSASDSFDRALMHALARAGPSTPKVVPVAGDEWPTPAEASPTTANLGIAFAESMSMEDCLLHNFAIAGFADGSGLKVTDIIEVITEYRIKASATRTTSGYSKITHEDKIRLKAQYWHKQPRAVEGSTSGNALSGESGVTEMPEVNSAEKIRETNDVDAYLGSDLHHAETRPDLRELLRVAAYAKNIRRQQCQQRVRILLAE